MAPAKFPRISSPTLELLVQRVTTPTAQDTETATPGDDTQAQNPTLEWLIVVCLFCAMLLLGIGASAVIFCLQRSRSSASGGQDASNDPRRGSLFNAIHILDEVAPAQTYKRLKADRKESARFPDQAGSSVTCVICLGTLSSTDMVRQLPCNHIYHASCIGKWCLKQHYTCPLCLASFAPRLSSEVPAVAQPLPTHAPSETGRESSLDHGPPV